MKEALWYESAISEVPRGVSQSPELSKLEVYESKFRTLFNIESNSENPVKLLRELNKGLGINGKIANETNSIRFYGGLFHNLGIIEDLKFPHSGVIEWRRRMEKKYGLYSEYSYRNIHEDVSSIKHWEETVRNFFTRIRQEPMWVLQWKTQDPPSITTRQVGIGVDFSGNRYFVPTGGPFKYEKLNYTNNFNLEETKPFLVEAVKQPLVTKMEPIFSGRPINDYSGGLGGFGCGCGVGFGCGCGH